MGSNGLLLVTMAILYEVVVQHSIADDNTFLIDKLKAVRADLVDKEASQGRLLENEVPIEATDYFIRALDRHTGEVLAERPKMAKLPPSVLPSPPPNGQTPAQGVQYKTSTGTCFLLISSVAGLDSVTPHPLLLQI